MADNVEHEPSSMQEINPKVASDVHHWARELGVTGEFCTRRFGYMGLRLRRCRLPWHGTTIAKRANTTRQVPKHRHSWFGE